MRSCYASVEILSKWLSPEGQLFQKGKLPKVKKETRDESDHHVTSWMWAIAYWAVIQLLAGSRQISLATLTKIADYFTHEMTPK